MAKLGDTSYQPMLGSVLEAPSPHEPQHFEIKEFPKLQPYWPLMIPFDVPPILAADLEAALERTRPAASPASLARYVAWNDKFGSQ